METKVCPQRGLMIKDKWGKWRKAISITCINCNNLSVVRTWSNRELTTFCSRECSDVYRANLKRTLITCAYCGKSSSKRNSALSNSKSGLYFCDRKCKDLGQQYEFGLKEIWPDHYGTREHVYRDLVDIVECVSCGNNNTWQLQVHHIDGDRQNNVLSNLEVVCANCHCNRHSKIIDGKRILLTSYITPREEVKMLDMGD